MNGFSKGARDSTSRDPLLSLREVDIAPAGTSSPVLRTVCFEVHRGECLALVGPSGSGKTTLLRTIATLLQPVGGTIRFEDCDPSQLVAAQLRAVRARVGLITQKHDLVESVRVDTNVMAGALGRWSVLRAFRFLIWPTPQELNEASTALAAVGLADKLKRRTSTLSGGEQQRVAIARALVQAPSLLLADEPVASLDPATADEVLNLLTRLARASGMALICSLHQPELATRFCDRVLEVQNGTIVQRPTPLSVPEIARG